MLLHALQNASDASCSSKIDVYHRLSRYAWFKATVKASRHRDSAACTSGRGNTSRTDGKNKRQNKVRMDQKAYACGTAPKRILVWAVSKEGATRLILMGTATLSCTVFPEVQHQKRRPYHQFRSQG